MAAEVDTVVAQSARDRDVLGGELDEERPALVRARTLALKAKWNPRDMNSLGALNEVLAKITSISKNRPIARIIAKTGVTVGPRGLPSKLGGAAAGSMVTPKYADVPEDTR